MVENELLVRSRLEWDVLETGVREVNELEPLTDRHFGQSRPKPPSPPIPARSIV